MAILSTIGQVTAGTSAVRLVTDAASQNTKLLRGIAIALPSGTTGNIYWGPSGVTTSSGFPLVTGSQINPADVDTIGDIYLISDTASQKVGVNIVAQPGLTLAS